MRMAQAVVATLGGLAAVATGCSASRDFLETTREECLEVSKSVALEEETDLGSADRLVDLAALGASGTLWLEELDVPGEHAWLLSAVDCETKGTYERYRQDGRCADYRFVPRLSVRCTFKLEVDALVSEVVVPGEVAFNGSHDSLKTDFVERERGTALLRDALATADYEEFGVFVDMEPPGELYFRARKESGTDTVGSGDLVD